MKFDASEYNFSNPGDDEAMFLLFRDGLKALLCNIAQFVSPSFECFICIDIDPHSSRLPISLTWIQNHNIVLAFAQNLVAALDNPRLSFTDIEVVVHFVYLLGELIPVRSIVA